MKSNCYVEVYVVLVNGFILASSVLLVTSFNIAIH